MSFLSPAFLIKTLLWLLTVFPVWYFFAKILVWPALILSDLLLPLALPGVVDAVEVNGFYAQIVTTLGVQTSQELPIGFFRFSMDAIQTGKGNPFVLIFPLDVLKYGYGLPFVTAMILASVSPWLKKLTLVIAVFLLVTLIQTWGVCFNTAQALLTQMGDTFTQQTYAVLPLLNTEFARQIILLGYTFGFLILPAVAPLALWLSMQK